MKKNLNSFLSILVFTLLVGTSGCTPSAEEQVFEGEWSLVAVNTLPIARTETIEVSAADLGVPVQSPLERLEVTDANGKKLISQAIDMDGDSHHELLIFQLTFSPNQEQKISLRAMKNSQVAVDTVAKAKLYPEQLEDYAWENDRVAFRTYGPMSQKMVERGAAGGHKDAGIDPWLKTVDHLVVESWYEKDNRLDHSYHLDTGEGFDSYFTGRSRGCGGTAYKIDTGYVNATNFSKVKTICSGPIRASFLFYHEPYQAGDKLITETKLISLDKGSNMMRQAVTVNGADRLAAGVSLPNSFRTVATDSTSWVSHWEPHEGSFLGMGIVTHDNYFSALDIDQSTEIDLGNVFAQLKVIDSQTVFYAGFGWKGRGIFNSKEEWNNYLRSFAKRLAAPIELTIKG